jgi:hypothetical protein
MLWGLMDACMDFDHGTKTDPSINVFKIKTMVDDFRLGIQYLWYTLLLLVMGPRWGLMV